jgi:hypothetical protein
MAEAKPSLQEAQARAMCAAIMTLAQRSAIIAVKRQLQAQGIKLSGMSHREIVATAHDFLTEHRARLFADAAESVRNDPGLRTLVERSARSYMRNRI